MEELQDNELIRHYLEGDESAFEVLYQRYRTRLFGYLSGLLPYQPAEAEDIYQQTWIKVIAQLRHQKRQPQMQEIDREDMPEISAAPGAEPWRGMDEAELGNMIHQSLEMLTQEQKEVFLLRQAGIPFKEIARLQQCSLNTALARMQYALKKMKKQLLSIDQGGLIQ